MKRTLLLTLCLLAAPLFAQDPQPAETAKPEEPPKGVVGTEKPEMKTTAPEKLEPAELKAQGSYLLGVQIGMTLGRQFFRSEIDQEAFVKGMQEAMAGDLKGDPRTFQETARSFFESLEKARSAEFEKNKAAGTQMLAENAKKDGIKVLASGLQYKIIRSGAADGKSPTLVDQVTCHYTGTLIDGTEFDSSHKHPDKQPVTFPAKGVIRGWTEALQLMRIGDKWQLFIPESLAYGEQGSPPKIPPGSTLVFEIELLDIKPLPPPRNPGGGMPFQMPPQG